MPQKKTITTVIEVWADGDWARALTLAQLAKFVDEAREAGFLETDTPSTGGHAINDIRLTRTAKETA